MPLSVFDERRIECFYANRDGTEFSPRYSYPYGPESFPNESSAWKWLDENAGYPLQSVTVNGVLGDKNTVKIGNPHMGIYIGYRLKVVRPYPYITPSQKEEATDEP